MQLFVCSLQCIDGVVAIKSECSGTVELDSIRTTKVGGAFDRSIVVAKSS